jgi:hypothetical protein
LLVHALQLLLKLFTQQDCGLLRCAQVLLGWLAGACRAQGFPTQKGEQHPACCSRLLGKPDAARLASSSCSGLRAILRT